MFDGKLSHCTYISLREHQKKNYTLRKQYLRNFRLGVHYLKHLSKTEMNSLNSICHGVFLSDRAGKGGVNPDRKMLLT